MKEFRGALSRGWDKYRGAIEFGVSKKLKFVGEQVSTASMPQP